MRTQAYANTFVQTSIVIFIFVAYKAILIPLMYFAVRLAVLYVILCNGLGKTENTNNSTIIQWWIMKDNIILKREDKFESVI